MESIRIPIEASLTTLRSQLNTATSRFEAFGRQISWVSNIPIGLNTQSFQREIREASEYLNTTMSASAMQAGIKIDAGIKKGVASSKKHIEDFQTQMGITQSFVLNEAQKTSIGLSNAYSRSLDGVKKQVSDIPASIKKITDQSEALPLIKLRLDETGIFDQLKKGATNANGSIASIFDSTKNQLKSFAEYLNPELFFDNATRGVFYRRVAEVFLSPFEKIKSPLKKSVISVSDTIVSGIKGTDKLLAKGLIKIPDLIENPDKGLYSILQPMLQGIEDFSKKTRRNRNKTFDRATFFDETVPAFADKWMKSISGVIEKESQVIARQSKKVGISLLQMKRDYSKSYTGQAINETMFKFGRNTGLISFAQDSASQIKSIYGGATDYILSRLAIVGKAQKGTESRATFTFYKTVLTDIGDLMTKALTPGTPLRRTAAVAGMTSAAFTGVSKSVKGVYSNTSLLGNSFGKLAKNVFDFKNNFEGALTTTVFLAQKIAGNFVVQNLTAIGDIKTLIMGLIPNLGTIAQMMGILNKYSAGPLLMQARYANVVKQLAIAEKLLVSLTNRAGQALSSMKGMSLAINMVVAPAKLGLAWTDLLMTITAFNAQLQMAIVGAFTLGDSIVMSAESLLGGQGFMMPGMLATGPTVLSMFQIDQGIESAVNYDQMTKNLQTVATAGGATREEMEGLRSEILKMSGDSTLTFQQISDGITEMAANSYSVDEISNNFKALSQTAQATGLELRDVVGAVQNVATAYKLDDLGGTGQTLARLSSMTGTSLVEISKAMVELQGVALSTKTEFSDLATFVATLTDSTGRFSSQSVATIQAIYKKIDDISRGKEGSEESMNMLKRLGISKDDLEITPGELKPIDDIMMTLREKISKATKESPQATSILSEWLQFNGTLDTNVITQSLSSLGVGIDTSELKNSLKDVRKELETSQEYIEKLSDEQNKTFTGQLQRLVNATFAVSTSVGRMFQPFFAGWIEGSLMIANWFNKLGDGLQRFGISLQVLIPIAIIYFKLWTLHLRIIKGVGTAYKSFLLLLDQKSRMEFIKNMTDDLKGLKNKILEVGDSARGVLSGRVAPQTALQDTLNVVGKYGKANMDEFIGTTKEVSRNLLAPVDILNRWVLSLTRVNVSMTPVLESLSSMGKKLLEAGKAGAESAIWQGVGLAGDVKKRVSGINVGKERVTNAYKMAMGYGAETMPMVGDKNVYENMNFTQGLALMAVQIGLVVVAWKTLQALFTRSEGAKIAEETNKLNKELKDFYKTVGLAPKDKTIVEQGKGVLAGARNMISGIKDIYDSIDLLTPIESQLGKMEQSLEKRSATEFKPKVAPIKQEISYKQAGKAVIDLYMDARKGAGGARAVDNTNLRLGATGLKKADTRDFTNNLNKLIIQSFVIQKTNAVQKWAVGIKDEIGIGLVKGAKATVGFVSSIRDFYKGVEETTSKFVSNLGPRMKDAMVNLYESISTYIERIKAVGFIEASREALSKDPNSSFGEDVKSSDVMWGIGATTGALIAFTVGIKALAVATAGSIAGITTAAIALNPLTAVIVGVVAVLIGIFVALRNAWKTGKQTGNAQAMLAKDEMIKTTDVSLDSSNKVLEQYGIANKKELAGAKAKLTPGQISEADTAISGQINILQENIKALEKTKSATPEEQAGTDIQIKKLKDQVNLLRHRAGVIKGEIALNEKLVYSYKELNDQIAGMNYKRELGMAYRNAKYEKELASDPDKLINEEKQVAKERAKMREDDIRNGINALAEEKRKLKERTQYVPKNEEEIKDHDTAKKRLLDIDLEYNKQITDLAKAQQDERIRLNKEAVDSEMGKIKKLQDGQKLSQTKSTIKIETEFGQGKIDKSTYEDSKNKLQLTALANEKSLLKQELDSYIKLNNEKNLSDSELAQKRVEIEQKTADLTLQILEEKNKQALEKELKNIEKIEAEKTRVLLQQSRNKESQENELTRKTELTSAKNENKKLPIEKTQGQLDYQLQIAEITRNDIAAQKIKEEIFKNQLALKQTEIESEKESLKLQAQSRQISLEKAKIDSEMAVIEAQANLSRAIANKEGQGEINKLKDELRYKQDLVANADKNIKNNQLITKLEEERVKLSSENELAIMNQTRQAELLREKMENITREVEKQNKANKENELKTQIGNKEKLLGLVGTGGFDLASNLMGDKEALTSLDNQIKTLQFRLSELNKLQLGPDSQEVLDVEQELNETILNKRLTILNQEIELKKQISTESQKQIKLIEDEITLTEAKNSLQQALTEQVKARTSAELSLLEIQKSALDKTASNYETADPDILIKFLQEQERVQKRIDSAKLNAAKKELETNLANLGIEEKREALASKKQRAELQSNVLQARDAMLQADGSGNPLAVQLARQQLDIASQALSTFEEQDAINQSIRNTKKTTIAIEGQSIINQEKLNQKIASQERQQEKINILSRNATAEIDKQQKKLQTIADLNKAIRDYRINALEKESSILDDVIGMRKELDNPESDMPDSLRKELNLQVEALKPGSGKQSEKSLFAERLNIEQRLAKERTRALLAEQAMEKAMFDMETRKIDMEMRTAELQAKLVALQAKGTPLEKEANIVAEEARKAREDNIADRLMAEDAMKTKQAMERYNQDVENTKNVNATRRQAAESGYTPEGTPWKMPKISDENYKVPRLKEVKVKPTIDKSAKVASEFIDNAKAVSDWQKKETKAFIDQIKNKAYLGQDQKTTSAPGPEGPNPIDNSVTIGSVTVVSSNPTGDATKVVNDLRKINNNKA